MSRGALPEKLVAADPELQLLAAACGYVFDSFAGARISELGSSTTDWARFLRLARFHRVEGLAWHGLDRAGAAPPEQLRRAAQVIAAQNLAMAVACSDLRDRFEQAGVALLFLKGLPLGVLAYGTPWLKAAVDIDLLVDEAQLDQAIELLRASGFRREGGRPEDVRALRRWHRFRKDSEWRRQGTPPVRVDLHTRLTDNEALIGGIGAASPKQIVEITSDVRLPTLADDELFAHLCVHGASSAWFRLKWITDLAALLHPKPAEEIARLHGRSQELGAGRAAGQALLLADALYGVLDGLPDLRHSLQSDGRTRWLYRIAIRQLAGRCEPVEPTARTGGTMPIHLSQFFLLGGPAFKASELVRQARAALATKLSG